MVMVMVVPHALSGRLSPSQITGLERSSQLAQGTVGVQIACIDVELIECGLRSAQIARAEITENRLQTRLLLLPIG